MQSEFLSASKREFERKHPHLFRLLTQEERDTFEQDINPSETPLWRHWETYVVKTLVLGKSPITIKTVRDGLNTIMRHTGIVTIEQANTPGVLGDALLELQMRRGQKPSTRNTYIKNMNVRRHIKWHRFRPGLRETLLTSLVDIKRRLCGIASVDVRWSFV